MQVKVLDVERGSIKLSIKDLVEENEDSGTDAVEDHD